MTQQPFASPPRVRIRYAPTLASQPLDDSQRLAFRLWNRTDKLEGPAPDAISFFPLQSGYRDLRLDYAGDRVDWIAYTLGDSTDFDVGSIRAPSNWAVLLPFFGPF